MAISSILRLISYSFNTNFLLINFAFVGKKLQKSPPGSATVVLTIVLIFRILWAVRHPSGERNAGVKAIQRGQWHL